jgi:hypothetical protein
MIGDDEDIREKTIALIKWLARTPEAQAEESQLISVLGSFLSSLSKPPRYPDSPGADACALPQEVLVESPLP